MVRIIDFKVRMNGEGEPFNALIVQGDIELAKSKETGLFYATAKKASIASTFDDKTCESLIGQELPGSVEKVACDAYEYTNEETGEVMTLEHRWVFVKEGETVGEVIQQEHHQEEPEMV